MVETNTTAIDKQELPAMEPGAMCYMVSKQGYLSDQDGHWHPHLMFFVWQADPAAWGADLPGSPVISSNDTLGAPGYVHGSSATVVGRNA